MSPVQSPGNRDEQEEDVERGVEENVLHGQQVAGAVAELMGGGEEDTEAVGRRNIRGTSLLVDEGGGGGSQRGIGNCGAPFEGERLLRIGGGCDKIFVGGDLVQDHGGGIGDIDWPTTRRFIVVVIGIGSVWEVGTVGGVGGIVRRVGGVYHSKTNGQAGRRRGRGGNCELQSRSSYTPPPCI